MYTDNVIKYTCTYNMQNYNYKATTFTTLTLVTLFTCNGQYTKIKLGKFQNVLNFICTPNYVKPKNISCKKFKVK